MKRFKNEVDIVVDTSTNLMWQRGKGFQLTFDDAQKYAASLTLAGHNNWRLPTIEELKSIVNHDKSNPAVDPVFECETTYYWSSTVVSNYLYGAWVIAFNGGPDHWDYKNNYNYVRCVRNNVIQEFVFEDSVEIEKVWPQEKWESEGQPVLWFKVEEVDEYEVQVDVAYGLMRLLVNGQEYSRSTNEVGIIIHDTIVVLDKFKFDTYKYIWV